MLAEVSVIIPTWNRAETIETAITSALRQTLPPLEILVCDDGSTDGTEKIVAAMGDNRVVWCPGPHGGQAAIPRNRGLARSRGEWIAFLDSDDEWLPEKLERQIEGATRLGCRAAAGNAGRKVPGKGVRGLVAAWKKERLSFRDLLVTNRIVSSTVVIHRSLLASVGQFPDQPQLVVGEDYAFWLRVAVLTDFAFILESQVIYRDDAVHSIRRRGKGPFVVRKHVLESFVDWCARERIDDRYREEAKKGLAPLGVIRANIARHCSEFRDRTGRERS
jgi:glycosyltransferase involved in cell wall biosynthesis